MYCKTVHNNLCATPNLIKNVRQECEDAELRQRMIKAIQEAKGELETQSRLFEATTSGFLDKIGV